MNVRPLSLIRATTLVAAAIAFLIAAPGAFAQNVEVTLEPLFVAPPTVEMGVTPFEYVLGGKSVRFPLVDVNNETATVYWGVYVESQSVSIESLRLTLAWSDGDDTLFFADGASVEGGILYGPQGYLARQSNPLLDILNADSPVEGAFDFGLTSGLVPSSNAKDLAGLIGFTASADVDDYDADTIFLVQVGVIADGDGIVSAGGGTPTLNGLPIVQGQNPVNVAIYMGFDGVPEPASASLLVSGVLALGLLERARTRRLARR